MAQNNRQTAAAFQQRSDDLQCANCGRKIGKLETPHLHGENVVCTECSHRLGVQGLNYVPKTTEEIPVSPPAIIEKKSKRYKLRQAAGVVIVITSFCGYLYARNSIGMDNDTGMLVGIGCGVTFLIGLILFMSARIGAWRNRG